MQVNAKAAPAAVSVPTEPEPEMCPHCDDGQVTVMSDGGPDAYDVQVNCPHCDGKQTLSAAYEGVVKLLEREERKYRESAAILYLGRANPSAAKRIEEIAEYLAKPKFDAAWARDRLLALADMARVTQPVTDGAKPAGEPAYTPVDLNAEDDTYEDDADLVVEYTAAYADWRLEGGSFAACEAAEKKLRAALAAAPDSQGAPKPVAYKSEFYTHIANIRAWARQWAQSGVARNAAIGSALDRLDSLYLATIGHPSASDGAQAAGQPAEGGAK